MSDQLSFQNPRSRMALLQQLQQNSDTSPARGGIGEGIARAGNSIFQALIAKQLMQQGEKQDYVKQEAAKAYMNAPDAPELNRIDLPQNSDGTPNIEAAPVTTQVRPAGQVGSNATREGLLATALGPEQALMMRLQKQQQREAEANKETIIPEYASVMKNGKITQINKRPVETDVLSPEAEAQKIRMAREAAIASRAPEKPMGVGAQFKNQFGTDVPPNMRPVIKDGAFDQGKLEPIPGSVADPTEIEKKRVEGLRVALPQTKGALNATIADLDNTLKTAYEILMPGNATGLGDVTGLGGTWIGDKMTAPGSSGSRVKAKIGMLEGKQFLTGLGNLKAQSPTGASGLGALSESEGKRVLQAQGALDRSQSEEDYRKAVGEYITTLEGTRKNILDKFKSEFSPVLPKIKVFNPTTGKIEERDAE